MCVRRVFIRLGVGCDEDEMKGEEMKDEKESRPVSEGSSFTLVLDVMKRRDGGCRGGE